MEQVVIGHGIKTTAVFRLKHKVNFQTSFSHRSHSLAEEPDTEYIAIVVAVVVFIVLFVTVNLVLDFFGVWFWVVFAAASSAFCFACGLCAGLGARELLLALNKEIRLWQEQCLSLEHLTEERVEGQ